MKKSILLLLLSLPLCGTFAGQARDKAQRKLNQAQAAMEKARKK